MKPSVFERRFWFFASAVILTLLVTRIFDFSLIPPMYDGIYVTRPFCGLHSWDLADRAWAARSHLKYGLSYTKGLRTLVVGDPPPLRPEYYVSHPPLETWVLAAGLLVCGRQDWSVRLFDLLFSVPCLLVILFLLRQLYGSTCALLSGLLLVLLPLSAYFGFFPLMILPSLWALYRYLQLMGRVNGVPKLPKRSLMELGLALFVLVQANWAGIFYAFVLELHYVVICIARRRVQWKFLAAIALPSLVSVGLNFSVMVYGMRNNIAVESPGKDSTLSASAKPDTPWGLILALYQWRGRTGERDFFSWSEWIITNLRLADTNFTAVVLLFLGAYLLYLLVARFHVLDRKVFRPPEPKATPEPPGVPYSFPHMWFLLVPALLFLFAFRGLFWNHEYWQCPFTLFVAVGGTLSLLLIRDIFGRIHLWFGRSVVAVLVLVIAVYCNQGLASYRAIRWHSLRTIDLFKHLNREIPPDKALLTFQDFMIQQNEGKVASYREEYAWYLDREMTVANTWQYNLGWIRLVHTGDVVEATVKEVQAQGQTGRYWFYMIPAGEEYRHDPRYGDSDGQQECGLLPNIAAVSRDGQALSNACSSGLEEKPRGVVALSEEELDRRLKDHHWDDDELLCWEKHRRYREAVIAQLKKLYRWEYCGNPARPGDEDFCYRGVTPCYLFDLLRPLPE